MFPYGITNKDLLAVFLLKPDNHVHKNLRLSDG